MMSTMLSTIFLLAFTGEQAVVFIAVALAVVGVIVLAFELTNTSIENKILKERVASLSGVHGKTSKDEIIVTQELSIHNLREELANRQKRILDLEELVRKATEG